MNTNDVEEIIRFTDLDPAIQNLIKKGAAVREYAYSPYSKFKVGAAVLCDDGTVSTGCNVENASYPVGTCAERAAIVKAVSEGKKKFLAITVVADKINNAFTTPCGLCRQAIAEFGNMAIYLTGPDMKDVMKSTLNILLPHSFSLESTDALQ